MRRGDRDAAADFFDRFRSRIRRRIRGKLSPPMRRLFDSQEILSTVGRRLDLYVRDGKLRAANEAQLWSLLFKMADHALIDKARLFRRLEAAEGADGEFARAQLERFRDADRRESEMGIAVEMEQIMALLPDETDRKILSLWMTGLRHTLIAEHIDLAPTAVRKRWQKIREQLRIRLEVDLSESRLAG